MFEKQCESRTKKDWVSTVIRDLEELGINVNFVDIQQMNKQKWKSITKQYIKEYTFTKLKEKQQKHSKVKDINYSRFEMQDYLAPSNENINKEESLLIFKLRSKMVNLKANYKNLYKTYECSNCNSENETQEHIYNGCKALQKEEISYKKEKPDYHQITSGNILEKQKVARIFMEQMKTRERLMNDKIS